MMLTLFFIAGYFCLPAQSVVGFWRVNSVQVGDQNLTPVAKWFFYTNDQTYRAGNGWTQNDIGTWEYDKVQKEFTPKSSINPNDEGYGAFKVHFSGDDMTWEREEDGALVVVNLSRITAMPMAPKDSISGAWQLIRVEQAGQDITDSYDPENTELLLIRNMQTYRKTNPDGSQAFGYWHMDAHHPELHLIDFDRAVDVQVFVVSFQGDVLHMRPKNNQETLYSYRKQ